MLGISKVTSSTVRSSVLLALRVVLGLVVGVIIGVQGSFAQNKISDEDLAKALRSGGHTIVMRHVAADPDKADSTPTNFKNIRTQQPLTEEGRASAKAFGDWLRAIGVPVGEVLTSRFNRCVQTALLAGFKQARPITELTEGSLVASPNEQRRRASALKQLLAAPINDGTVRLLVTHRANITQAFGKEWYEVREGEASIFKVANGSYSLVARVQIDDWARIAQAAAGKAQAVPAAAVPAQPATPQPATPPPVPAPAQAPAVPAKQP